MRRKGDAKATGVPQTRREGADQPTDPDAKTCEEPPRSR
jgi:hypothetical protein